MITPWLPELEIAVGTLQACVAAREGGADRIELCAALSEGGLTPSHGFIRAAVALGGPPIHVMLRPRSGNFVYSKAEFSVMRDDLRHALDLGAAGVVTGPLLPDYTVDVERMQEFVELAAGRPVTFHRAFDEAPDLERALEAVIAVGCARVLTSGGKPTVTEGTRELARLVSQAKVRIRIAAGGGVTLTTAPALRQIPGLDLHASLRRPRGEPGNDSLKASEIAAIDVAAMARIVHDLE
jgi:copper homeostasis protein